MASLSPYLNFKDNCREAFDFYRSVIGGEFQSQVTFSEFENPEQPTPDHVKHLIMHVSLPIGDSVLMGSDTPEGFGPPLQMGNNYHVSIHTDSKEQAKKYFDGLSKGGTVTMPIDDVPWNSYFGMFTDKFGINWMISYDYNTPS